GPMAPSGRGRRETPVGRDELRSNTCQPSSGVERVELASELSEPSVPSHDIQPRRPSQRMRQLRGVPRSHGQPGRDARKRRSGGEAVDGPTGLSNAGSNTRREAAAEAIDAVTEVVLPRNDQLGGSRRSGRAKVGNEVGEG